MMKLVILFAAVVAVASGAGPDSSAAVLRSDLDISPEGSYQSAYETENGIVGQETGQLKNLGGTDTPAIVVEGSFEYTNLEGQRIRINYIADENGYQPTGDSIPK